MDEVELCCIVVHCIYILYISCLSISLSIWELRRGVYGMERHKSMGCVNVYSL